MNGQFSCGLSIGVCNTVVSTTNYKDPNVIELCTNHLSGRVTPTVVSYTDRQRLIGDTAEDKLCTNPSASYSCLPMLLNVKSVADVEKVQARFGPLITFDSESFSEGAFSVSIPLLNGDERKIFVEPCQVFHAFLRDVENFGVKCQNEQRGGSEKVSADGGVYGIAIADSLLSDELTRRMTMRNLAKAINLGDVKMSQFLVCGQLTATIYAWIRKNMMSAWNSLPDVEEKEMIIGFCNFGFSESSYAAIRVSEKEPDDELERIKFDGKYISILCYEILSTVGTIDLIRAISTLVEKKACNNGGQGTNVVEKSFDPDLIGKQKDWKERKAALRVLQLGERVMKDLTGLTIASAMYWNEKFEATIEVRRDEFEECIKEYRDLVHEFLCRVDSVTRGHVSSAERSTFLGVEIVGGGCRIPCFQQDIEGVFGTIRKTLDASTSASHGALIIAKQDIPRFESLCWELQADDVDNEKDQLRSNEKVLDDLENDERERLMAKCDLEMELMKMQEVATTTGEKDLLKLIETTKEWFYDSDNYFTTDYRSRREEISNQGRLLCPDYFKNIEEERLKKEKDLERRSDEAKAQTASAAAVDEDDHDTRKLPNSQRLTMARKNKEEANELFKGGANAGALRHYLRAIQHVSKTDDNLTESETTEKTQLEISCTLNMALIYLKEGTDQTICKAESCCQSILQKEPTNPKALYRLALALEAKHDYVQAKQQLQKLINLQKSNTDPIAIKALHRIEEKIKAEQQKRKKMYARMMGTS